MGSGEEDVEAWRLFSLFFLRGGEGEGEGFDDGSSVSGCVCLSVVWFCDVGISSDVSVYHFPSCTYHE